MSFIVSLGSFVEGAKEDIVIPLPPSLREVPRARKAGAWRKESPHFSLLFGEVACCPTHVGSVTEGVKVFRRARRCLRSETEGATSL